MLLDGSYKPTLNRGCRVRGRLATDSQAKALEYTVDPAFVSLTPNENGPGAGAVNVTSSCRCSAGASVGLAVVQRAASGAEFVAQSWTLLADRVRELADGLWLVEGVEQGVRLGGAQKQAPVVMARMQDGMRVPADFDIVPGDSVDGAVVKSASTSIVANGSWFTEVRYG